MRDTLAFDSNLAFVRVSPWIVYIDEKARRITTGNRHPQIIISNIRPEYEKLYKKHEEKNARIIVPETREKNARFYRLYDPDNHIIEIREEF